MCNSIYSILSKISDNSYFAMFLKLIIHILQCFSNVYIHVDGTVFNFSHGLADCHMTSFNFQSVSKPQVNWLYLLALVNGIILG